MKGVILAGGLGTRLAPLTTVTNKHLLPIYNKPMIFYPIQTLVNAGIRDICIVYGGPHVGHFASVLKTGKHLGIENLEFAYQEKEGGIAEALALTERFAHGDSICVVLGDNTTDADIRDAVSSFKYGAKVFFKTVNDPQRYGVLSLAQDGEVLEIIEKPANPVSNLAVVGLYIYDNKVYDFIRNIKPSARGELEITDVNNLYIKHRLLQAEELDGFWTDAGTFESLFYANHYWKMVEEGNVRAVN